MYQGDLRAPVEHVERLDNNPACTRCEMHDGARRRCLPAEADRFSGPGGLLIVGEAPTRSEDQTGRPFQGPAGAHVRDVLRAIGYTGSYVLTLAVGCAPGARIAHKPSVLKAISACRGYLAAVLDEVQPSRVITIGSLASQAVLGRSLPHHSTRGAYGFLSNGVPVYQLFAAQLAVRNRFLRKNFTEDMRAAVFDPIPSRKFLEGKAYLVRTVAEAREAFRQVRLADWAALDIESWGLMFTKAFEINSLSITPKGSDDAFVFTRKALRDQDIVAEIVDWLTDPAAKKIGANIKFDAVGCYLFFGVMVAGISGDVRLWRKLLEPEADARLASMAELVGQGGHKHEAGVALADAAAKVGKRLGWEVRRERALAAGKNFKAEEPPTLAQMGIPAGIEKIVRDPDVKKGAWAYGLLPQEILYRYNGRDTVSTAALGVKLEAELAGTPQEAVWQKVTRGASEALTWVERWGVGVDRDALEFFDRHMTIMREDAKRQLDGYATINWGSAKQVADLFFKKWGMAPPKTSEVTGEHSVDREVLEILAPLHPAAAALMAYRRAMKLQGTYAHGMIRHIRDDGRIHASYLLDGTTTGRPSGKDPNLLNIPRTSTAEGKMARNIFVARRGWKLVQLDFSQLELRIAALLSGDPVMMQVFNSGVDYHMRTAQIISEYAWRITAEQCEKKHRDAAKAFNFGLMYGKTDQTLAEDLNIPVSLAAKIRAAILGTFTMLAAQLKEWLASARRTGESWTLWQGVPARRRSLWKIAEPENGVRRNAENGAVNTPIQGSAAEFCNASLWPCVEWILDNGVPAKMVGTVYDSIMFEVRDDAVDDLIGFAHGVMTGHDSGNVPLVVDVEVGERWGELSKVGVPGKSSA